MKNNDWKIKKNVEKKDEKIITSYWQWYTLQKTAVWFSIGQSTEHAIVELVDQVRNVFESNQYTFGVFDTFPKFSVNHKILIKNYWIRGKNLLWFISYLINRTHFINITT